MHRKMGLIFAAVLLTAMAPLAAAKDKSIDQRNEASLDRAFQALQGGNPALAKSLVTPVLADYEKTYAGEKRKIYCGMTPEQTIAYMAMAASHNGGSAVAISPGWCTAQYIQAYALVDLKRLDEAQVAFERLLEFAPQHARFLNESAYVLLQKRQWQASLEVYGRAAAAADLMPERRDSERCVALRGVGYDLVELGRLDDAEASYRKCLAIIPNDPKSLGEIQYINQQRRKAA